MIPRTGSSRWLPFLTLLASATFRLQAHPDLSVALENFGEKIRINPQAYSERAERAWLILGHDDIGPFFPEDIDTLLAHAEWRSQGQRLNAIRLFQLGRLSEAETQVRKNLGTPADGPEQPRLLARIELSKRDTGKAIQIYRAAWDKRHEEADYLNLLELYQGKRVLPTSLLDQGIRLYTNSPGVAEAIYNAYRRMGGPSNLQKSLELSQRAQSEWWPASVDWKIRYARILLDLGRKESAAAILLKALDLLDRDPRLQTNTGSTPLIRKEIFTLLEVAKLPK